MKRLFLLVAIMAMVLPSCKKINEAIDSLGSRLDKLEQETIPSIDEQISAINTTLGNLDAMDKELKGYIDNLTATASSLQEQINATNTKIDEVKKTLQKEIEDSNAENLAQLQTAKSEVLAQLATAKTELENELKQINITIETLKEKDKEIDKKIAELRSYVDTELGDTTDWVNATFATLEQYNALVSEVATIKEQIKAINQSITELETRLTTKINEDIATAVSTLNADIQQKVKDITDAYTNAIKSAKEEITSAYTTAIQTAITTLDKSLKTWVGEQLSNYYTIAQVDAMLATMAQEMNGKLEAQKAYLEGLINELSAALTKSIADNKVLIEGLRSDITTLQGDSAEHATKIADNATLISANAQSIIDNATAIANNGTDISANEKAIAYNKALIEANAKLIADNKSAIETLKNSTATAIAKNVTDITQNASAIAKNATLISQNATAIYNNITAIAKNSTDILQLQQDLTKTKKEITEAYQKAINDAISTNNGVINNKITNEVISINSRIDSEVATINNALDALTARVAILEREVNAIKQQIADILEDISNMKEDIANLLSRIQSISYIPQYDDGKATVKYFETISQVTLDFEISPKDAVAELAKVWESAVSLKAVYTETRAVSFIDMPIVKFESDTTNGVVSVTVSGENLSEGFFNGTQTASVRLAVSDGNNYVSSEYISLVPQSVTAEELGVVPTNTIFYQTNNNEIVSLGTSSDWGANIISNTYENGRGVIKFDGDIISIISFAFADRVSLTSITIPNSVKTIGDKAFRGCSIKSIDLPNGVTKIGMHAFFNCTNLTTITLPETITSIDYGAFKDCSNLEVVSLPNSITYLGDAVFEGCAGTLVINSNDMLAERSRLDTQLEGSNFTKVIIGNGITKIGDLKFKGYSPLVELTIPNSVTSLGMDAFYDCTSLSVIYCKAIVPPFCIKSAFQNTSIEKIYVPMDSVEAYKASSSWKTYASQIEGYEFE